MTSKADKERMGLIKSNMPCLPCILAVSRVRLPSVQHVVEGRKRLGHQETYASCEWHHFGMNHDGMSRQEMSGLLGPSLAHGKRSFQAFFGPERLLVKLQNKLIASFVDSPWIDYAMPSDLHRSVQQLWIYSK